MNNRMIYFCAIALLFGAAHVTAADEFVFQRADGLKLLIYDNSVEPAQNKLLSNFHDKEFIIDGEGYVQLGSFGRIYVAGKNLEEAREYFEEKFKPYGKDLVLFIIPLIRVVMKGEFGKTGMYRFDPKISFWDAVAQAGGMSNSLAAENMYLLRGGEIVYADFMEALYAGASLEELGIQSGDELIAPRINRISFQSLMRYVSFFSSLVLVYFALTDKQRN